MASSEAGSSRDDKSPAGLPSATARIARRNTLALREIRTGRTSDGMVEIRAGLSPGEKVVTSGTVFIDRAARAD